MWSKISRLPGPLKVVVWLNIVAALFAAVSGLATLILAPPVTTLVNFGSAVVSGLIVIGIVQRSKLVRMLVLIFGWLGIVFYSIAFVWALVEIGLIGVMITIPLAISAVTVWGLMATVSKQYFRGDGGEVAQFLERSITSGTNVSVAINLIRERFAIVGEPRHRDSSDTGFDTIVELEASTFIIRLFSQSGIVKSWNVG